MPLTRFDCSPGNLARGFFMPVIRNHMQSRKGGSVVVDEPQFMHCFVSDPREDGSREIVARFSGLVKSTSPLRQQWSDYLRKYCFSIDSEESFKDKLWIFGGGVVQKGTMYDRCPGGD